MEVLAMNASINCQLCCLLLSFWTAFGGDFLGSQLFKARDGSREGHEAGEVERGISRPFFVLPFGEGFIADEFWLSSLSWLSSREIIPFRLNGQDGRSWDEDRARGTL
jgi:hypothetical protein